MAASLVELIATSPSKSEEEEIWGVIRTWLGILRIVVFFAIILITEIFAEYLFRGWSVGIWALIIGIPLFFVISIVLIVGDKKLAPEADLERIEKARALQDSLEEKAVLRPIRERY
jgi:uncharacterized membrane protein